MTGALEWGCMGVIIEDFVEGQWIALSYKTIIIAPQLKIDAWIGYRKYYSDIAILFVGENVIHNNLPGR